MRMRKKRRREERLAACENITVTDLGAGGWDEVFGRGGPLHVEIGCGKGKFVTESAQKHPEIRFLAVEKCLDVLVLAMERAVALELNNVRFVPGDVKALAEWFPKGQADRIYLNFSDPWPKNSTAKRRLTADSFLELYRGMLTPGGGIWMKTDNRRLFEFSLQSFQKNGFTLKNICYDLHNSDFSENVVTEYEANFAAQGMPIYRLEAYVTE